MQHTLDVYVNPSSLSRPIEGVPTFDEGATNGFTMVDPMYYV